MTQTRKTSKTKTRAGKATTKAARAVGKPAFDLYQTVTDKIVAALEAGAKPWVKPWIAGNVPAAVRPLRHNGVPYKGLNVLLLWAEQQVHGYASPFWMTFNQAKTYGGNVKKGARSTIVTYATRVTKTETNDKGEEESKGFFVWKFFYVFNAEQCENLPDRFYVKGPVAPVAEAVQKQRIEHAEAYFGKVGAKVNHGGHLAFYAPSADRIQVPSFDDFKDAESYYSTLGHEHIHWTGAETRLNRTFGKRFGDEAYAFEELIAELGAAFLCADLQLALEPREDHAGYLDHWLKVLKADKKAIFTASSQAQRAVEHLHGLAGEFQVPSDAEEDVAVEEVAQPLALAA